MIEQRALGRTGLRVTAIGLGAGHIGGEDQDEQEVEQLLGGALDAGLNLIDTARGYGKSEARIGRFLSHRRHQFVLSTKIGYGMPGIPDWTADVIAAGITEALHLLRTDYLDIVHLHSCPVEVLKNSALLEALSREVQTGRIRVAAYSGENEALDYALATGVFGSIQCSVNVSDQRCIEQAIAVAHRQGIGVIAKRPLANAPWRFNRRPSGDYAEEYWQRWQAMNLDLAGLEPLEFTLRFALSVSGVSSGIVGTSKMDHLLTCVQLAEKGPLPDSLFQAARDAFKAHDRNWVGQI